MLNGQENINQRNFMIRAAMKLLNGDILDTPAEGAVQGYLIANLGVFFLQQSGLVSGLPDFSDRAVAAMGAATILGAATGFWNQMRQENRNNPPVNEVQPHND